MIHGYVMGHKLPGSIPIIALAPGQGLYKAQLDGFLNLNILCLVVLSLFWMPSIVHGQILRNRLNAELLIQVMSFFI